MGTVGFSAKKKEIVIGPVVESDKVMVQPDKVMRPDTTWFKPHCNKCPYLQKDDEKKIAFCWRPIGESCLAESLLVAQLLITEQYNNLKRRMADSFKSIKHKKIKRRR